MEWKNRRCPKEAKEVGQKRRTHTVTHTPFKGEGQMMGRSPIDWPNVTTKAQGHNA